MLPECRTNGDVFAIPKFSIEKGDVEGFLNELKAFHGEFRDCFSRSEPRENFFRYMVGQFSELERKSIEPIALSVEGGRVRSMQRAISDAPWDDNEILTKYRSMVNEDMGHRSGVVIFDETAFVKKGNDSVGVGKQYCGTVGKVENCQVGVFAAYASPHGYALVDKRLFIPEEWFTDHYGARRKKCKVPEPRQFKSKPQLAVEILEALHKQQNLPFKYVVADTIYGNSPAFIEAVENCLGVSYFVSIPSDTLCWLNRPITRQKSYRYKGELRTKTVVDKTEKKPISVKTLAENINDYFWYRRTVSEGTKGPIDYEFTKRQVIIANKGLPEKTVWLIIKRIVGNNPIYSYYISNAPVSTRLKTFVWLSGMRWAIEQCFEETKGDLGMDQYEVRKYPGWNHHILTCMLAHFFLWHLKIRLGKKSTCYYSVAA
ncbi:MAG: IS701 family transposase [Deltaproteobacteria bacterium]|nr:MAG: IS701 family transposase [Deltaproteobacteria bacterium]